jgi:hypothetical protein
MTTLLWILLQAAGPVPVIFDADMDSDCDDVAALALLHALADRGEAEILGTLSASTNPDTPRCMAAVNAFYKRPGLSVGAARAKTAVGRPSKYARGVAGDVAVAPVDAVDLYEKLLRERPERTVTIVTVGYLTNVAELLRRPGGPELARRARLWVCMGGNFVGRPPKDDLKLGNVNFTTEKDGALHAVRAWPGPLTFVGREIGSVPSGLKIGARFAELAEGHPVRVAYALYFGGAPKDRHVADLTAVLFAVRGAGDRWDVESRGWMDLRPDMTFEWRTDRDPGQAYVVKKAVDTAAIDRRIERELESLLVN